MSFHLISPRVVLSMLFLFVLLVGVSALKSPAVAVVDDTRPISGTVSLPAGHVAPEGGIDVTIYVVDRIDHNAGYPETTTTVPEGDVSASYSVAVPATAGARYRVYYYITGTEYDEYVESAYYASARTTWNSESATLLDVGGGDVSNIDMMMLEANIISGTIFLPTGHVAPVGGINGNIVIGLPDENGVITLFHVGIIEVGGENNSETDFTIPSGSNSTAYTAKVADDATGGGYTVGYELANAFDSYATEGLYTQTGTKWTDTALATRVDVSGGDVSNIHMTLIEGNSVSGTISLPAGKVAPERGIYISVAFENSAGFGSGYFSMPAGSASVPYTYGVPINVAGEGYQVSYCVHTDAVCIDEGYYSSTGTTQDQSQATPVDVRVGNVSGINFTLLTLGVDAPDDGGTPVTPEPVTVTSIAVKTPPTKTTYTEGDLLDLSGLVVTFTKSDGSTEDVGYADFAANGILTSLESGQILTVDDVTIEISSADRSVSQAIVVVPQSSVTVTDIAIATPPTTTTYMEGDLLDLSGLVITLTKSDNSTEDVGYADFAARDITTSIAHRTALAVGDSAVQLTINGHTASQMITVTAHPNPKNPNAFISKWDTTKIRDYSSNDNQVMLPLVICTEFFINAPCNGGGNYNFTVDWGDGSTEVVLGAGKKIVHTYNTPGIYEITIDGTIQGFNFGEDVPFGGDRPVYNWGEGSKILEISQWGSLNLGNKGGYFRDTPNLKITATDILDLSGTTDLSEMFFGSEVSTVIGINEWDVSKVTDMRGMFKDAKDFNQPIGNWDVSSVTDMSGMFSSAQAFNQPIGTWDVSSVTDMSDMFFNARSFNQPLDHWDVSKVTDMKGMFAVAKNFNQPIGNWDVSSVNDMSGMFMDWTGSCFHSFNQPIGSWDVSSVTNMSHMFLCADNFNQPLDTWDVSKVTDMKGMFASTDKFNQPIGNWDVSSVTDMSDMFGDGTTGEATSFNQPIGNWNVSKVTDMSGMFSWATAFNQPIGNWDVSSVTDMNSMFSGPNIFNQPIDNWDVSNVTNMQRMFGQLAGSSYGNPRFNQPIGSWDVSKVTNMKEMFFSYTTRPFNQPLGNWDVSSVTDMRAMFYGADNFNQPLDTWDVSSVYEMTEMFSGATSFNQSLGTWDVSAAWYMDGMFSGVTLSPVNYNDLLIGWSSRPSLHRGTSFDGGNSKYDLGAPADARKYLSDQYDWTITDGGSTSNFATIYTDIGIKTPPTKTTYTDGNLLDLSGLVVTLTRSDNTTSNVAFEDFAANNITTSKSNGAVLTTSDTHFIITINGHIDHWTTQNIQVVSNGWNSFVPQSAGCSPIRDFQYSGSGTPKEYLVVITHGWKGSATDAWVTGMQTSIFGHVNHASTSVRTFDWKEGAALAPYNMLDPMNLSFVGDAWLAYNNAYDQGLCLAKQILALKPMPKSIHLIAHSAGSNVIQTATYEIAKSFGFTGGPGTPLMHLTFLDAFAPAEESQDYGALYGLDGYAEQYVDTRLVGPLPSKDATDVMLPNVTNFDVTSIDKQQADPHSWPYILYDLSVQQSPLYKLGFPFASENTSAYRIIPYDLPGAWCTVKSISEPYAVCPRYDFEKRVDHGNDWIESIGFLSDTVVGAVQPIAAPVGKAIIDQMSIMGTVNFTNGILGMTTNSPSWVKFDLTVTEPVNLIEFDVLYPAETGDGVFAVFLDERLVFTEHNSLVDADQKNHHVIRFPETLTEGPHEVIFRIDPLTETQSQIDISDVRLGMETVTKTEVPIDVTTPEDTPSTPPSSSNGRRSGSSGGSSASSRDTSITINKGAASTTKQEVTLALLARLNRGPITMQISNDNAFTASPWITYRASYPWKLADGVGEKTVYARFKDGKNVVSKTVSDTIEFVATQGVSTKPAPKGKALGLVRGASTFRFNQDLGMGMQHGDVVELQERLRADGHFAYPSNTGYYGPATYSAVQAYQRQGGIDPTGYVGPLTRARLNGSASAANAPAGNLSEVSLEGFVRLLLALGVIAPEKADTALAALGAL